MEFSKNEDKRRFELKEDGQAAYIDFFEVDRSKIYLTHIEVPEDWQGQGIASRLAERTLSYIRDEELSLIPKCTYISKFIRKNPEYRRILDESVNL